MPPHGDPNYRQARGPAALSPDEITDLDGTFGLHPGLAGLQPLFAAGELRIHHAAGLPGARSHFDAQDVLENGTGAPKGARDGWLNRALVAHPQVGEAVAIGATLPLVLRGDAPATSLEPTRPPVAEGDFLDQVAELYARDPLLGPAYQRALDARGEAEPTGRRRLRGRDKGGVAMAQIEATAAMLVEPEGPRIAVFDVGGWDTHAQQRPRLTRQLSGLTDALLGLRAALGEAVWDETVVLVVTEFGRTVAGNGTGGTDHGRAGIALELGGAVQGGVVSARWPGLSTRALERGRDLAVTTDLRDVFAATLVDHLGVPADRVARTVFPGARLAER